MRKLSSLKNVQDGDWLLFRSRKDIDLVSDAIMAGGRSPYYHAGMACWSHGRLMCVETKQYVGGRSVSVANLLSSDPVLAIDVRHITAKRYNREKAVGGMLDFTGRNYGWRALLKTTLTKVIILRWFIRPSNNDNENGSLPYCSMAVSRASQKAGFDPVKLLSSGFTEPGDLGRVSDTIAPYIGTLYLSKKGHLAIRKEKVG
jgi:hypothetical protein